jgi:hypothetical protein
MFGRLPESKISTDATKGHKSAHTGLLLMEKRSAIS